MYIELQLKVKRIAMVDRFIFSGYFLLRDLLCYCEAGLLQNKQINNAI
jgi:hypothetical protein